MRQLRCGDLKPGDILLLVAGYERFSGLGLWRDRCYGGFSSGDPCGVEREPERVFQALQGCRQAEDTEAAGI